MKLTAHIIGNLEKGLREKARHIGRAVTQGINIAGKGLKRDLATQVKNAGLGNRLARTWQHRTFKNKDIDAATLVYSRSPGIIAAFDHTTVIRSKKGRWLAIPTKEAPKRGTDGKRITPLTFPERRFGALRFVKRRTGHSLLVVDGFKTGRRSFATKQSYRKGQRSVTLVMFVLVPQVRINKRLDVRRAAEYWSQKLASLIDQQVENY